MILPPTIPIAFLLLGALAVGASTLARLRRPSLVMTVAAVLAIAAVATLRSDEPVSQIVSGWLPISVFGVPVSFRVDQAAWIVGLGLTLAVAATALTWIAYPGQRRPTPRALSLLMIAAALASVFASNLLTLALAWGTLDVVFIAALLAHRGPEIGRRAALAIILNTSSTLCVWIAALVVEHSNGSLYWHLLKASPEVSDWLAAAGVLRLGLYPLHQWLPIELDREPDRSVLLIAIPSMVGLALWARLALAQALPIESIVPTLAVLSALVGALLAWRSPQPRQGLPLAALSLLGLAVVGAVTPTTIGTPTVAALNWLFIVVCLFISRGLDRRSPWWMGGAVIAGLSLAGIPGTLGFIVRDQLIGGLIESQAWFMLAALLIAEALLIGYTARLIVTPADEAEPCSSLRQISFGLALAVAAVPLVAFALASSLAPGVPTLQAMLVDMSAADGLAWAAPIVVGLILAWQNHRVVPVESALATQPIWASWLRLEWLTRLVAYPVRWIAEVVRRLAGVVEGEGGLVWAMLMIVIALVLSSGAFK